MTWLTDKLPPVEDLGALAVAQTWQVTLVAVVAGIAAVTVARRRPHLAYLLWMLVVIKCLTPPLWGSPTGAFSWLSAPPRSQLQQAQPLPPTPEMPANTIETVPLELTLPTSPIVNDPFPRAPEVNRPIDFAMLLALAWFSGALAVGGAAAWQGWRYRRRLRESSVAVDAELDRLFATTRSRLGVRRRIRLLVSRDSLGPAAQGILWPTIVISQALAATASRDELEPILAHELLHHRRGDVLAGWLQLFAQVLWWFHPLVWWANRAATRERERACDEEVVAGLGCDPAHYAQGLIGVLELRRSLRPMFVPGMRPADISKRRIERILNESAGFHRRTPRWCWGIAAVLALVALPGAAREPEKATASKPTSETINEPENAVERQFAKNHGPENTHPITIHGRAFDESGKPVAGATIHLLSTNGTDAELGTVTTDELGRYAFRDVNLPIRSGRGIEPQGWYEIYGTAPGKGLAWTPLRTYLPRGPRDGAIEFYVGTPPNRGRSPIQIDLNFRKECSVTGRFVDEKGRPIASAEIRMAYCDDLQPSKHPDGHNLGISETSFWAVEQLPDSLKKTVTDRDGRFELAGLTDGLALGIEVMHPRHGRYLYRVATTDDPNAKDPRLPSKLILRDVQGRLPRSRPVHVEITYSDTGKAAEKARLFTSRGDQPRAFAAEEAEHSGKMEIDLPPGSYKLEVDPPSLDEPLPYVRTSREFVVRELTPAESASDDLPERQREAIQLQPGAMVEFQVIDVDTGEGIPLVEIKEEQTDETRALNWWMVPHHGTTDETGRFHGVVLPGSRKYFVNRNVLPTHTVVEEPNEPLLLEAGKTTKAKFLLRKKPAPPQRVDIKDGVIIQYDNSIKKMIAVIDQPSKLRTGSSATKPPSNAWVSGMFQSDDESKAGFKVPPVTNFYPPSLFVESANSARELPKKVPASSTMTKPSTIWVLGSNDNEKVVPNPALNGSLEHESAVIANRGLGGTVEGNQLPIESSTQRLTFDRPPGHLAFGPVGKKGEVVPDPALEGSPEHFRAVVALRGLGATVEGKLLPGGQSEISVTISAGWKAGPDGLKHLAQLDHLERLSINDILAVVVDKKEGLYRYQVNGSTEHGVNDAWLAHLAELKSLKALEIHNNCHATDAGLAHLAGLVNLEVLAIGGEGITDTGMMHLAPLTKLRRVYLSNVKIADAGLAALAGAKELELLSISSSELHGEGFAVLAGLERLNDLGLQYCPIDDKGLEAISNFKLKRLLLGNAQITDAGLAHLKNQTDLVMLTMEEPKSADFTGAGLVNLAGLKSLQDYRLQVSKLAADDLAALNGMKQLSQLILNAPVTDEGLVHLAKLTQLKFLYLLGAELSDAGLKQLYGLQQLKTLVLPSKGLSEEAKAALQQALPNAEFKWLPIEAK